MNAVLDENHIDHELLWRLGKIVTLWAMVDSWLAMLHGTLLGADLAMTSYVTSSISDALQIKCIRALLSVHAHKEPATPRVIDLLTRADEMRIERNELIHGLWNAKGCELGTIMVNTVNLERAEIIRDRFVTVTDLDELIEHIEQWIADYATLGAEIGFPRNKNATRSFFLDLP